MEAAISLRQANLLGDQLEALLMLQYNRGHIDSLYSLEVAKYSLSFRRLNRAELINCVYIILIIRAYQCGRAHVVVSLSSFISCSTFSGTYPFYLHKLVMLYCVPTPEDVCIHCF